MPAQPNLLPPSYQGLSGTQALAQVFLKRTDEAMAAGMPSFTLQSYLKSFNEATTFQAKQAVLRAITLDLNKRS